MTIAVYVPNPSQVKGLQVAPAELEGHLLTYPQVADAAVIGTPDEYAGELPKAFVVLQPAAASLAAQDPKYGDELRLSIYKVCNCISIMIRYDSILLSMRHS